MLSGSCQSGDVRIVSYTNLATILTPPTSNTAPNTVHATPPTPNTIDENYGVGEPEACQLRLNFTKRNTVTK